MIFDANWCGRSICFTLSPLGPHPNVSSQRSITELNRGAHMDRLFSRQVQKPNICICSMIVFVFIYFVVKHRGAEGEI